MEFGKVNPALLNSIDFTLPADPAGNSALLQHGQGNTQFHIGCARWSVKEWAGNYYPKSAKAGNYLEAYAQQFNCVELNATYYGTPSLAQIVSWKEKAGNRDFLFCPKLPQEITHTNRLLNSDALVADFVYAMAGLGAHAGPIFLMPDPEIGLADLPVIKNFISRFPAGVPLFLELRHPSFFVKGYNDALLDFLVTHHCGTVITDTAGRRDCVHARLSSPKAFIRFVGNALHPTDYSRIDAWVSRLKHWMDAGLEEVYFFVHQPDERCTPVLISYLIESLNKHCGTCLKMPEPIKPAAPPSLF